MPSVLEKQSWRRIWCSCCMFLLFTNLQEGENTTPSLSYHTNKKYNQLNNFINFDNSKTIRICSFVFQYLSYNIFLSWSYWKNSSIFLGFMIQTKTKDSEKRRAQKHYTYIQPLYNTHMKLNELLRGTIRIVSDGIGRCS